MHLTQLLALCTEILVLGTGARLERINPSVLALLKRKGIAVEVQDTVKYAHVSASQSANALFWQEDFLTVSLHLCSSVYSLLCCSQMHAQPSTSWVVSEEWQPLVWSLRQSARHWIWHGNKCHVVNRDWDWFLQMEIGGLQMITGLPKEQTQSHPALKKQSMCLVTVALFTYSCSLFGDEGVKSSRRQSTDLIMYLMYAV